MPIAITREVQIGTGTDWIAASGGYQYKPILLKAGGTLWQWDFKTSPDRDPHGFTMKQFGKHSDWVGMGELGDGFISLAADGSLWLWQFEENRYYDPGDQILHPLLQQSRKPQYLGNIFNGEH